MALDLRSTQSQSARRATQKTPGANRGGLSSSGTEIQVFRGRSMPEALARVKQALGGEAAILGTRTVQPEGLSSLMSRPYVEITAAPAGAVTTAPRIKPRPTSASSIPAPSQARSNPGVRTPFAQTPDLHPAVRAGRRDDLHDSLAPQRWEPPSLDASSSNGGTARSSRGRSPEAAVSRNADFPEVMSVNSSTPLTPTPQIAAPGDSVDPLVAELVSQEVGQGLAERLVARARAASGGTGQRFERQTRANLRAFIADMIPPNSGIKCTAGALRRVALIGPPGAGKTSALAKLAAQLKLRDRRRVQILSLDFERVGAHTQLERYGALIGVPVHQAQSVQDVKQCLRGLDGDVLLIDTPGVGVREQARFTRLAALLRASRPDETHLVLPVTSADTIRGRIVASFAPLRPENVILTHLDEAVGFGIVLNVVDQVEAKLSYLSTGQRIPSDLTAACSEQVSELL